MASSGRERVLAALDGRSPTGPARARFYHVDGEALAPPGAVARRLVDVAFVAFPVSAEEEELRRRAMPYDGNTRIGSPSQVARYARWGYRPEDAGCRQPPGAGGDAWPTSSASRSRGRSGTARGRRSRRQVDDLHGLGLAAGGNTPHLGGELFEAAWRLRGLESFLVDLVERKEMAHFLLDRLAELARRNAATLASAGVDVLALDDDVGMPGTMMISPATWREFFRPRLAGIIDAARAVKPDIRVIYHSDGHFEPILDDLVEIGVAAHQPAPAGAHGRGPHPPAVRAAAGAVGHRRPPDDVRLRHAPTRSAREVRTRIETLGRAGLVLCPAYDIDEPDIPWANVAAFLEAGRTWG